MFSYMINRIKPELDLYAIFPVVPCPIKSLRHDCIGVNLSMDIHPSETLWQYTEGGGGRLGGQINCVQAYSSTAFHKGLDT